jgi:hypothetical protein
MIAVLFWGIVFLLGFAKIGETIGYEKLIFSYVAIAIIKDIFYDK